MFLTFNAESINSNHIIRMWVSLKQDNISHLFDKYILTIKMTDSKILTETFSSKKQAFEMMQEIEDRINTSIKIN